MAKAHKVAFMANLKKGANSMSAFGHAASKLFFWTTLSPRLARSWLLWSCFVGTAAIFITNLVGLIILVTRRHLVKRHPELYIPDPPIFFGSCETAETIGTVLHVLINGLSTSMLAASNVCMQMLLSPTRSEIDKMHRQCKWLHIGYSSFGNFRHVTVDRRMAWVLLAVSSVPLHLL
jgi:hypothetical protein